jgi:hypothetical protein
MNKEEKVKLVMIGSCPNCGKEYVRVSIVDAAACDCQNPDAVLVPLEPALIVSKRTYAKFAKLAQLAGVSVERLANEMLMEGARQTLEKLKLTGELVKLPEIVVTTKKR